LSKYTIVPDSRVPLVMVCHFQSIINYSIRHEKVSWKWHRGPKIR